MKTILFLFVLIVAGQTAQGSTTGATMKQIAGDYDISFRPIANMIAHVKEDGHLDLEVFAMLYLNCTGDEGYIENNVFSINPNCNGASISLKIDLSKVKNFNKFKAPVYSSMLGSTVEMEFTRR